MHDPCPPPAIPSDLKAKKIVVKRSAKKKNELKTKTEDPNEESDDILSDLEDDLFNGGYIDLDTEEDEEDDDI